ncbi:uncharacterized protein LOC131011398 [Salvia miltiorrhiza]|uniref:uncharacterized protein LOC131011398 n=1 Tax=Salvia miltiorrhiza TaxID=226208 RepID=UPI0025AC4FEB|nr:uncharacterized protein LOC131011398 [Salvia miltiorrhiza]
MEFLLGDEQMLVALVFMLQKIKKCNSWILMSSYMNSLSVNRVLLLNSKECGFRGSFPTYSRLALRLINVSLCSRCMHIPSVPKSPLSFDSQLQMSLHLHLLLDSVSLFLTFRFVVVKVMKG